MKKILSTLLAIIVILGVFAGVGLAGYRMGYSQGATASGNTPSFGFYHMNPSQMPMHRFDNDFGRWNQYGHSPSMMYGGGFGFFTPFMFLGRIVFWALAIWFVYWLFTKNGWRITRESGQDTSTPKE